MPTTIAPSSHRLLTMREAAKQRLNVSERTVWAMIQRGDLRAVRIGRSVRIDPRELDRFLAAAAVSH